MKKKYTQKNTVNANYSTSNECIDMQFFYIYNTKTKANERKMNKKIKIINSNKQTNKNNSKIKRFTEIRC